MLTGADQPPVALTEEAFAVLRCSGKAVANCLLIGALALVIPAAAGCEAGDNAPTLEFHQAAGGAYTTFNNISITNAFVLGAPSGSSVPAGSSASLFVSLFNGGTGDDQLVSVSAPDYATSVKVTGGTVGLPPQGQVNLTGPQPSVVLSGLTKPLAGSEVIPVTFDFAHAGSVTLQVPVQPQSFYYSTYSPPPTPEPTTASPTTTPKAKAKAKPKATATPTP
jgi:copper(I)-binding protein